MQKSKREIIDETAAAYTSTNRAVNRHGDCLYISATTGNMCAVGRCCEAPIETWWGAWFQLRESEMDDALGYEERQQLLKPEYRGHCDEFWTGLQELHDFDLYWTPKGLSREGERRVAQLHAEWDEQCTTTKQLS